MEERPNRLSQIIDNGGKKLRINNWANGLLSLKSVLAHIVKACIPEYTLFPVELIKEECFDSFTDTSGMCNPEIAKALMTKKPLPNGYMMDCDLLLEILPPKHLRGNWTPHLLNIEMQNDSRQLDRCIGRGMLYLSGIYYMEYEQRYRYPEFEKALKVNSVWICPAAPPERQGTVQRIRMMAEEKPKGCAPPPRDFYDKLRLTFVNAGETMKPYRRDICGFIWALTTLKLSAEARKTWLKEAFEMEMTQVVEKEIDEYDWYLQLCGRDLYEKKMKQYYKEDLEKEREKGEKIGFAKGQQSCFAKGEQSGFEKGEQSGLEKGIEQTKENFARNMLKYNYRLEEISRMADLSIERVSQIARDNNLGNS
ncbi:MAG: hypothetical protein IKZ84_08815 [Victivallales bacterium]|nr:hypothetical protein [Victivallales bacterium]